MSESQVSDARVRERAGEGSPTVAVIGGGIAGLSAAWELIAGTRPTNVVVLEADDRLGGKILSGEIGGRRVDLGPDAFVARRPEAITLCNELGIEEELVAPGARGAFVWARGRLRPMPQDIALGIPTRVGSLARSGVVGPLGVARATMDLLGPFGPRWPAVKRDPGWASGDVSVGDVVRSRLGGQCLRRLADPLIGGINAGSVSDMSAGAVFPPLLSACGSRRGLMRKLRPKRGTLGAAEESPTPVFLKPSGGVERIVQALSDRLEEKGAELRRGARVGQIAQGSGGWTVSCGSGDLRVDGVVVAVPAPGAAQLLAQCMPDLAKHLGGIDYSSVALVTMTFAEGAVDLLDGTGFLVPAEQGLLTSACTWMSKKWPRSKKPGEELVRASCGRFGDDRPSGLSDDEIAARVLDELRPTTGVRADPREVVVTRWPGAFPQYRVGHPQLVRTMKDICAASRPPIALAGAALDGVGIPACIGSGRSAARSVMDRLAGEPARSGCP